MSPLLFLSALIIFPLIVYRVSRRYIPRHKFLVLGIAFGVIVAPFSLGLYSWFHFSPLGVIPGIVGLVMVLVHEPPGFQLATHLGMIHGVEVSSDIMQHVIVEACNSVIWSFVYGLLGAAIDYFRNRTKPGRYPGPFNS